MVQSLDCRCIGSTQPCWQEVANPLRMCSLQPSRYLPTNTFNGVVSLILYIDVAFTYLLMTL